MRARGFSLLEAMVTLVILSLITTVLMQSLVHVLGIRERVLRHDAEAGRVRLQEQWFRDSVASAAGDLAIGSGRFVGDETRLRFLSLDPLADSEPQTVTWQWVEGGEREVLEYRQGEQGWPVIAGGLEQGTFRYLDSAGAWHTTWPPAQAANAAALPRAVRLTAQGSVRSIDWWASLPAGPGLVPPLQRREEGLDVSF